MATGNLNQVIWRRCGTGRNLNGTPDYMVGTGGYKFSSLSQELIGSQVISYIKSFLNRDMNHHVNTLPDKKILLGPAVVYKYQAEQTIFAEYSYVLAKGGSFSAQAFIGEIGDYPCKYFGSDSFDASTKNDDYYYPAGIPDYLPTQKLMENPKFDFKKVGEFIARNDKQKLANAVNFLIDENNRSKTLFIKAQGEDIQLWIAAMLYAFPPQLAQQFSFSTRYNTNFKEFYNIIGTDDRDEYNFADAKNVPTAQCAWLDELPPVKFEGYFELITKFDGDHREFVQDLCKKLTSFDMEKAYLEDYEKLKNYQSPEGVKKEFEENESSPEKQTKDIEHFVSNYDTSSFCWKNIASYIILNISNFNKGNFEDNKIIFKKFYTIVRTELNKICSQEEIKNIADDKIKQVCIGILTREIKAVGLEKFLYLFDEFDDAIKKNILEPLEKSLKTFIHEENIFQNPQETLSAMQVYKEFMTVLSKKLDIKITLQSLHEYAKSNVFNGLNKTFKSSTDTARKIIEMFADTNINSEGKHWFFDCALDYSKNNLELCKFVLHEVGPTVGWNKVFADIKNNSWFQDFACEVLEKYAKNKIIDFIAILFNSKCPQEAKKNILLKIDKKLTLAKYDDEQIKIADAIQRTEWGWACQNSKEIITAEKIKKENRIKEQQELEERTNYLDLIVAYWISVYKKKIKLNEFKKFLDSVTEKDEDKKTRLEKLFPDNRLQKITDKVNTEESDKYKNLHKNIPDLNQDEFDIILALIKKATLSEQQLFWIIKFLTNAKKDYLSQFIIIFKDEKITIAKNKNKSSENLIKFIIEMLCYINKYKLDIDISIDLHRVLRALFENLIEEKEKIKDTVNAINSSQDEKFKNYVYTQFPQLLKLGVKKQEADNKKKNANQGEKKTIVKDAKNGKKKNSSKSKNTSKINIVLKILIAVSIVAGIVSAGALGWFLLSNNGGGKHQGEKNISTSYDTKSSEIESENEAEPQDKSDDSENKSLEVIKTTETTQATTEPAVGTTTEPIEESAAELNGEDTAKPPKTFTYTVRNGDALSKIAERFKIKLVDLAEYNNLPAPDYPIKADQELTIPIPEKYMAQTGETLLTIAKLFGVDVKELMELNPKIEEDNTDIKEETVLQILSPEPTTESGG